MKFGCISGPRFGKPRLGRGSGALSARLMVWIGFGYALFGACAVLGAENERIVEAFNWTVVFLMAMPYVILATVAGWIFYRYTRSSRKKVIDRPASSVHLVKKGASSR